MFSCLTLFGQEEQKAFAISDVPNVQLNDSTRFVTDPAHYLNASEIRDLDKTLLDLRHRYNVDFAIVLLPNIKDNSLEDFTYELFKAWGLGQKGKDTGLLLLVLPERRKLRFETGYGLEGIIPDALLGQVIRNDIAPHFREKNIALGLEQSIKRIAQRLKKNQAELLNGAKGRPHQQGVRSKQIPSSAFFYFYSFFVLLIYVSLLFNLYIGKRTIKKQGEARQRLPEVKAGLIVGPLISILLLIPFFGIIFTLKLNDEDYAIAMVLLAVFALYFIALFLLTRSYQQYIQKLASHCPNCGKSSLEVKPNFKSKLSPQQSLEFQIKAKTFTYFHCAHCSYEEVVAHIVKPSKYTLCPECQTLAVAPIARRSIVYQGVSYLRTEYKCLYCRNNSSKDERNKREEAENLAQGLLLGALLGSGMGRRGGGFSGGGFSGGSWGGGMSGGGGASGSW